MFVAHDAGHLGITHNFIADTLIGMFVADLTCGLSIGWWKSSHNVHHLVTNQPVRSNPFQSCAYPLIFNRNMTPISRTYLSLLSAPQCSTIPSPVTTVALLSIGMP